MGLHATYKVQVTASFIQLPNPSTRQWNPPLLTPNLEHLWLHQLVSVRPVQSVRTKKMSHDIYHCFKCNNVARQGFTQYNPVLVASVIALDVNPTPEVNEPI